jgi:CheY-like chemotaxis protein
VQISERSAVDLTVGLDLAPGPAPVWADPARLTQVLCNLLGNAFKFTPGGGRIEIRTGRQGPHWEIAVADTGVGIDPQRLDDIFGAFEQGGPDIPRRFGGLGLGLAISRAIVELHGGELEAASAGRGKGAEFTLRLPMELPEKAAEGLAAGGTERREEPVPPLAILLVEDHPDTAEALAELLRLLGHQVTMAGSVAAALAALEAGSFDLAVSDLGLPDGSGNDLMRHFAARGMPGIALSGFGMEEDLRRSREAGFRLHLTKPVSFDRVEQAIREVVRGGRTT